MSSIRILTCIVMLAMAARLTEGFSVEQRIIAPEVDNCEALLDNHDMIYQAFPDTLRGNEPSEKVSAGVCCKEFSEQYVEVGTAVKVVTPNYPERYPSDMECGWNFTTAAGYTFDMSCWFENLKQNDYLDLQESEASYTYFENVQSTNAYHYFWSNSVKVGFHSDGETGASGFECFLWPVPECATPMALQ